MNEQAIRIIEHAGGATAFAKLLGLEADEGFQQRVNNWKRRGLPSKVVLAHHDLIKKLQKQLDSQANAS